MKTSMILITLAAVLSACAPRKEPPPAAGTESSRKGFVPAALPGVSIESLGLELAGPSASDPSLPGDELFQGGIAALNPSYDEDEREIILRRTLNLPASGSEKSIFFVWPQGEGDHQIVQASFEIRNQGSDNRMTGAPVYELASRLPDGKKYFISLDRALSGRAQDLSGADQQVLSVQILLKNGSEVNLKLRFHVAGPLVALTLVRDEQLGPTFDRGAFERPGTPFALRRVTLQNPMARKVTLWVRGAPARQGLWLTARELYDSRPDRAPLLFQWQAPLHLESVIVEQRGSRRSFPYEGSGWAPISFGPGEQASLEWVALSTGCRPMRGAAVGFLAEGDWAMDTWLTDGWVPSSPSRVAASSPSLSLDTGRVAYGFRASAGQWGGSPQSQSSCR